MAGPTTPSTWELDGGAPLRAGFAYVLAGLLARGTTRLHDVWFLERGDEGIPGKLAALGVPVRQITD